MGMMTGFGLLALLFGGLGLFGYALVGGFQLREEMIARRKERDGDAGG